MRKQARALLTYEKVLDSAAAEIAQLGYESTNLQAVATRTGLTKGALYGHFASKAMLADTLVAHLEETLRILLAPAADPDVPALDRLRTFTCALAARTRSDIRISAAVRLLIDQAAAGRAPTDLLTELRQEILALVREAQRQGDLRADRPAEAVADLLLAALLAGHRTALATGSPDRPGDLSDTWLLLLPPRAKS
ncbi:TetR family transcriptional regulator [Kitasatospora sp. LaBMicrA B282]|uniref:TetR family transcriptional regulator n=1 Tax=Kitasatospora sp. LaBMicrA B282 TaxID=3420949 RepID=UPI003D0F5D15